MNSCQSLLLKQNLVQEPHYMYHMIKLKDAKIGQIIFAYIKQEKLSWLSNFYQKRGLVLVNMKEENYVNFTKYGIIMKRP